MTSIATHNAVETLIAALGPERVSSSRADLLAHAYDAWPVSSVLRRLGEHPYLPDVVVRPTGTDEVIATLAIAREADVPVTAWGLGSSVTGQPLATAGGITLDMSACVEGPTLEETDATVTVGAGYRGSDLEQWLQERGFTLNHFPQSLTRSTVGGWLSTRATGQESSRYGGIEDLVVGYEVVLADGTVVEVGSRPRASVGPDLRHLFLGSEGAFGIVTRVTLRVFRLPAQRVLDTFRVPDVAAGLRIMRAVCQAGLRPSIVRLYDEAEARHAAPAVGGCVLFLMCEGLAPVAEAEFAECRRICAAEGATPAGPEPLERWLERRYDFSTVEGVLAQTGGYAETVEVAHLWTGIEELYRRLRAALEPCADEVLCHFSHVYDQGTSLYVIMLGRAESDRAAQERLADIWAIAMAVTVECGGELSHHHGAGLARAPFLEEGLRGQHELVRRMKNALDPAGMLNPGKLGLP